MIFDYSLVNTPKNSKSKLLLSNQDHLIENTRIRL